MVIIIGYTPNVTLIKNKCNQISKISTNSQLHLRNTEGNRRQPDGILSCLANYA